MSDQAPVKPERKFHDRELGEVVAAVADGWNCPECRYNLEGQAIHVEPTYGFLVCRCPECGRVWPTQVQELKPSTRRMIVYASALVWWGAVFGGTLGVGLFLFGMAASASQWVSWRHDATSWAALSDLLWFPPVMILVAVTAAIGLPHLRAGRLQMLAVGSVVIGALSTVAYHLSDLNRSPDFEEVAASVLHMVVGCATLVVSVMLARPIARLVAVLFMSKKMRVSLSALWIADGRTPPDMKPPQR